MHAHGSICSLHECSVPIESPRTDPLEPEGKQAVHCALSRGAQPPVPPPNVHFGVDVAGGLLGELEAACPIPPPELGMPNTEGLGMGGAVSARRGVSALRSLRISASLSEAGAPSAWRPL